MRKAEGAAAAAQVAQTVEAAAVLPTEVAVPQAAAAAAHPVTVILLKSVLKLAQWAKNFRMKRLRSWQLQVLETSLSKPAEPDQSPFNGADLHLYFVHHQQLQVLQRTKSSAGTTRRPATQPARNRCPSGLVKGTQPSDN